MLIYTVKRFFEMIIVFFLFLIISYLLFNAIPGNAFSSLLLNPLLPPETYQRTIELFGLDKPLFERVQLYIINFFKGDFGYSYIYYPRSPIEVIAERLPRTLMLFSIVNVISFYSGFLVGKVLAWSEAQVISKKMETILFEDLPYLVLFTPPLIEAYRDNVEFPYTEVLGAMSNLYGLPGSVKVNK